MRNRVMTRGTNTILFVPLAVAMICVVTVAEAQTRAGRAEISMGVIYQLGADLDFDGGASVSTDDDFGLTIEGGYNLTDNLATNFGLQWAGVSYTADVLDEDGNPARIRGSLDDFSLFGNAVYYFGDGALAPYVGAGIGWTWIDTNVPTGRPITSCWWDPWWGYVCYTSYPTRTTDAFSYQAMLGIRYEFGYDKYLRLDYTSRWVGLSRADGTPRFDALTLDFGWMF